MLFLVTVWREMGNKRQRVFSNEVSARDPIQALEKSCVRFSGDRIVEIRVLHPVTTRPSVTRVSRNGVF